MYMHSTPLQLLTSFCTINSVLVVRSTTILCSRVQLGYMYIQWRYMQRQGEFFFVRERGMVLISWLK